MGNCQRRQIRQVSIQQNDVKKKLCQKHKIEITFICQEQTCQQMGEGICRKCVTQYHKNHNIEEIQQFNEKVNHNCNQLKELQGSIRYIKNYRNYYTSQKDLMRPFLENMNHVNAQILSQQKPKIEESLRLKLERTALKIFKEQDKEITRKEDDIIQAVNNMSTIQVDSNFQQQIASFQFSSTYSEMINYHLYQSQKQMNQLTQQLNPYKFDYTSFKNVLKTPLIIQKDLKYMKLKTCCRIDSRFAAIHFRNHLNESDFYIIDLIDENVIYSYKHQPSMQNNLDYLYKISYLGNYYISFNFITYVLIKDFSTLIQSSLAKKNNVSKEYSSSKFSLNTLSAESSEMKEIEKRLKVIKIVPKNFVFSVDKIKSGKLCLMEQQSEFLLEIRDYTIWNFRKKQCIRTLNITGHYVYDIFSNYIVLECSFQTFTLFNWQTNQVYKTYTNLYEYLNKFNGKSDLDQYYDIQAVKIFAIQKLLTTKDDSFMNSYPSFEDWLKSLPFQYKQMVIFEDTWLFKYDRTAIIMLQQSLLIYDMNLNKIVSQLELKMPSEQISFIWQAGNKLVYITKEGLFLFYE
ncbi:hypothetical protein ABPG72_006633 [Tetrahymena utriculariae]